MPPKVQGLVDILLKHESMVMLTEPQVLVLEEQTETNAMKLSTLPLVLQIGD
jgi:hypothetical protein